MSQGQVSPLLSDGGPLCTSSFQSNHNHDLTSSQSVSEFVTTISGGSHSQSTIHHVVPTHELALKHIVPKANQYHQVSTHEPAIVQPIQVSNGASQRNGFQPNMHIGIIPRLMTSLPSANNNAKAGKSQSNICSGDPKLGLRSSLRHIISLRPHVESKFNEQTKEVLVRIFAPQQLFAPCSTFVETTHEQFMLEATVNVENVQMDDG